ncbi:uncharacterized protein HMPREF1541_07552 [Cyphellophora europaea CBS 101466]|uniref:Uncharacterized protein n=1 Tax=Cyphellophora europaea (strain CBS 101466) TaxID=1220924 RepID=W2RQD8_CYPE1|nr:uncharacterized protein HMPREF1541_07552 [Cyphellophora europaea CBS 101466]ETN37929.1 hypothetical protein HMPREF1541_07552 [Cyphellophora europaea CBS 101466]
MASTALISSFALVLLLLCALFEVSVAFPTEPLGNLTDVPTHPLTKRGCKFNTETAQWECDTDFPTTSQLISQMQDEPGGLATKDKFVAFYSNLNDPSLAPGKDPSLSWVVGWLDANGFAGKYYWWGKCVNQYWLNAQSAFIRENAQKYKDKWGADALSTFEKCFFQSMALASQQPESIVLTPSDKGWKDDSLWAAIEFPTLTRNNNVKRIWRVDPRPPKDRGDEEGCAPDKPQLIWDRARDKVKKLPWVCPFAD